MVRIVVYTIAGAILGLILPGILNNYLFSAALLPISLWPVYLLVLAVLGAVLGNYLNKKDSQISN